MPIRKTPHLILSILAVLLATAAVPTEAHHSFAAEFDSNKPMTVTGVVTRVEWTNPHAYIFVDVTDKDGKVENWGFEMGPPHMLQRAGWKKNTLTIGEQVTVEGWMARNRSQYANARKVTRVSTGEVLGAASSGGQTLTGASGATTPGVQ
jgi:DNA/RNA endonuclease YhcR with UshA esterase domain